MESPTTPLSSRSRAGKTGRQRGFTLVELGLAIGVGVMLMYAGILAYDQARSSTGDAIARRKVADLQQLVEQSYTANDFFPDLNSVVRQQWLVRRPTDATASPWGGPVVQTATTDDGIEGGDLNGPSCVAPSPCTPANVPDNTNNSGVLYYYRISVPGTAPQSAIWQFQDDSLGQAGNVATPTWVPAAGYMVAANEKFHCFYFVTSGRTP